MTKEEIQHLENLNTISYVQEVFKSDQFQADEKLGSVLIAFEEEDNKISVNASCSPHFRSSLIINIYLELLNTHPDLTKDVFNILIFETRAYLKANDPEEPASIN